MIKYADELTTDDSIEIAGIWYQILAISPNPYDCMVLSLSMAQMPPKDRDEANPSATLIVPKRLTITVDEIERMEPFRANHEGGTVIVDQ